MDAIIERHGELSSLPPMGTVRAHRGCDAHAANTLTCCCAYEREVTLRRLRTARRAVDDVVGGIAAWQARLAGATRLRNLRRRASVAMARWKAIALGTTASRRMLVRAARAFVARRSGRWLDAWRRVARHRALRRRAASDAYESRRRARRLATTRAWARAARKAKLL